jgi:hypothetical protein
MYSNLSRYWTNLDYILQIQRALHAVYSNGYLYIYCTASTESNAESKKQTAQQTKKAYQILCTANTASNAYSSGTEDTESIAKVHYISQYSRYGRKTAGTTNKADTVQEAQQIYVYMYCILHTMSVRTEDAAIIIIF